MRELAYYIYLRSSNNAAAAVYNDAMTVHQDARSDAVT